MIHQAISLSVENLACIRSDNPVFARLNFQAGAGEAVLLRGPNGAGKSSLLRILAGLLPPASGQVRWNGGTAETLPDLVYCGHRDPVKSWLSVREHLEFWRALQNGGSVEEAAEAMGLTQLMSVSGGLLSAGQKRRLALARLRLAKAPVWLLDEPTVSLDQDGVGQLESLIADHRANGGLVIAATHTAIDLDGAQTIHLQRGQQRQPDEAGGSELPAAGSEGAAG